MWKSTSFASVSQTRTKRSEGLFSSVPTASWRRCLISVVRVPAVRGPRRGDEADVLLQDAIDTAEPTRRIRARGALLHRLEGVLVLPLREERVRVEAMARGVVGALFGRLRVRVDRERERLRARQAFEPLAGEAARVGAEREELEDRAVRACRLIEIATRFEDLAQRDERENVARLIGVPLVGLVEGAVLVAARQIVHHGLEAAFVGVRLREVRHVRVGRVRRRRIAAADEVDALREGRIAGAAGRGNRTRLVAVARHTFSASLPAPSASASLTSPVAESVTRTESEPRRVGSALSADW